MSGDTVNIVLFVIALLLSAGFSSSEAAFLSIQRGKLAALGKTDTAKANRINRFASQPEKLLATVLTGNNLANTAAAALGTTIILSYMDGVSAVITSTVVVTVLLLIFSEAIPKTLATRYSIGYASLAAVPLRIVETILLPPIWAIERLVRGLTRLLGLPTAAIVSQEELQALIELGAKSGDVAPTQAEILDQVFRMQDRRISDVMTYRTDVVAIPEGATLDEFMAVHRDNPHTRYPVYRGTLDHVVGILSRRSVMDGLAESRFGPDDDVTVDARPAMFIPETVRMGDMFRQLPNLSAEMLVLVDEYGGVIGVVTVRQMIEELVGHFDEMESPDPEEYEIVESGSVTLNGDMQVDEVNEVLALDVPTGPYETMSGFAMTTLGAVPRPGATFVQGQYQYRVVEMDGLKVTLLNATAIVGAERPIAPDVTAA